MYTWIRFNLFVKTVSLFADTDGRLPLAQKMYLFMKCLDSYVFSPEIALTSASELMPMHEELS
jgi:hypothetical protein